MADRTVSLQVKILSDDPRDEAPERIRMEVQRALALWLGPEKVYVEVDQTAEAVGYAMTDTSNGGRV